MPTAPARRSAGRGRRLPAHRAAARRVSGARPRGHGHRVLAPALPAEAFCTRRNGFKTVLRTQESLRGAFDMIEEER